MSRPKPSVLLEHTNKQSYRCEQVLESEAIWAVFYQSKPFNLKSFNSNMDNAGPKYKKTSFSNPGHAINLAERLNELYNCNDFTVYKMTDGERIA
jgi:hypothetical protein